MASLTRLPSPQAYTVGWITALDKELAAATAVLDEEHKRPKGFKKHPRDDNNYAWGRIGDHHVVIASMAAGRYGIVSAATTAMQMVSSLPHLRFGLMVGIGAGVPRPNEGINIRLGDIVVSQPTETSPGVVQYDLGKLKVNGKSERVGSLAAPPEVLLKGLTSLKAHHMRKGSRVPKILEKMFQENSEMGQDGPDGFRRPADHYDQLCETSRSVQDAANISNIPKSARANLRKTPKIHYGIIASGNSVVKDGIARDEILKRLDDKCICFEMEAAGLMNNFPCLVIRGICDYADEDKNDRWQNYAAATAAAFTKELLEIMDSEDIEDTSPIGEAIKELGDEIVKMRVVQNETNRMIQSRDKADHSEMLQQWLSAPNPSTNYEKALDQRHQGSGSWFLQSREYSSWKTDRDSFLWLHGMPGCGKTILSSTIIQDLMEGPSRSEDVTVRPECDVDARGHKRVNDDEADAQNPTKKQKNDHGAATGMSEWEEAHQPTPCSKDICLYFYFDFTENQKQSLGNTLRSLISQLCSKEKDLESDLDSLYSSCDNGNRQPSIESLHKTFLSMIGKVGEVWIVIDALDECQTRKGNPNEGLLEWMDSLRSSQDVNIHFLVTSRPEQDIQSAIEKWTRKTDARIVGISIESDRTAEDIQDYIRARVTQSEGLSRWRLRPDVQEEIQTTLTDKAHGMFRWVSCQFDVLEGCYDPQTLRKALVSLPQTLSETYTRILAKIPDYKRHNTTRILQFLTFSQRPLRIEELVDAITVDLEHEPSFDIENRMPVPKEILRYCSSLVTFSEDTREIRLAHFSVKEFITSQEDKGVFTQSLKAYTAHESIIEVIVAYLLSIKDTGLRSVALKRKYHLGEYCAGHWATHATIVEENSPNARQRLLELFSNKESWYVCNKIFSLNVQEYDWAFEAQWPESVVKPLYLASSSGLKCLVKDLLRQGAEINAVTGEHGTALQIACKKGHSDVARILIEGGADVNIVGGSFMSGTALMTAIVANLIDIACLLINFGADPAIRGNILDQKLGKWGEIYPLHAACKMRAEKVVKALIDKNVDVNLKDEDYGTPLVIAAYCENENVVKLLLEHGADVNAENNKGNTALYEATNQHSGDIVQLLLEHGADVNAKNYEGDTALHEATNQHSGDIVQLLLEHGADVNAQNYEDNTVLHEATYGDQGDIVQLLLEHSANIHLRDHRGRAPLETAEQLGKEQIAQLLRTADGAAPPSFSYSLDHDSTFSQ